MISLPVSGKVSASIPRHTLSVREGVRKETAGSETIDGIWVCLHFPRIALDVFNPPEGTSFVVIEEIKGQYIVHTPCAVALAQGIVPGMPLHAAYVLCNNLSARLRDLVGEEKALQLLAEHIAKFTPSISLSPPDSLLLEVSKSLRLFGGFDPLYHLISEEFGENSVISSASAPGAALLLARNGMEVVVHKKSALKSVLSVCWIEDTGLAPILVQQLSKCGLHTLRDLWRLPRPDLARRFGTELISFLDKACGAEPDPRNRMLARTRFFRYLELPVETADSQLLIIAAEKLFEHARVFLQSHSSATEKMAFKLWHRGPTGSNKPYSSLVIRSQQVDRNPQRFLPQFCEKVARMEINRPVTGISLHIDQVLPYRRESEDIFARHISGNYSGENANHQDWQQLVDILGARLGSKMIYYVRPEEDHRPERAWRCNDRKSNRSSRKQGTKREKAQLPVRLRPLWLLDEPRKIPRGRYVLRQVSETERIESGWWDGNDFRRDYYIAVTPWGNRCWVFRDRNGMDDFYMHGLYG